MKIWEKIFWAIVGVLIIALTVEPDIAERAMKAYYEYRAQEVTMPENPAPAPENPPIAVSAQMAVD